MKVCADCTAIYASDLCPQCGGGAYRFDWEEEDMPKATVEGGGSIAGEHGPELVVMTDDAPVIPRAPKPKPAAKPKTPVSKPSVADADEDDN